MAYFFKRKRNVTADNGPVTESMNFAERWLSDGVSVCELPAGFLSVDVDMTSCEKIVAVWKESHVKGGIPALLVRAAALALSRYPQLHVMRVGYKRFYPEHVDIGLSVAGETFVAPLLVIRQAETKAIEAIAKEINERIPEIRMKERNMHRSLANLGWIVPLRALRRAALRFLFRRPWFRREGAGTFQVTCLPDVNLCVPYRISASGIMAAGGIFPRVVATPEGPAIRPVMTLTCSADHVIWDGMCHSLFLRTVKKILETGSFAEFTA